MQCGGYRPQIFEVALNQPQVLQGEGDESIPWALAGEQTVKSPVLESLIWISGPRVCIMNLSACVDFM